MNNDTGIYTITSPSGNKYVGSAVSFKRRWATHLNQLRAGNHHSGPLQKAFAKYGEAALMFEKIALCPITDLIAVEQRFIDKLKPKYNRSPNAGSTQGLKLGPHSEDHRSKIAKAHTGKRLSDEGRAYLASRLRGRKMPEGFKERQAAKMQGSGNPFFGKSHTAEAISKMSGDGHHSSRAVVCLETGMRFGSIGAAAKWLRVNGFPSASPSPICACCHGGPRYKKPYGYTWRFESDIALLEAA